MAISKTPKQVKEEEQINCLREGPANQPKSTLSCWKNLPPLIQNSDPPPKLSPQKTVSIVAFRTALTLDVKIVWFGEFVVRQHAARRDRIRLLANRAERTRAAQQAYEQTLPPPPVPPPAVLPPPRLPANESTDSINMEFTQKQTLLNQLANQAAEDITDPLDKAMFDYLDRVQAEAARAAFQKVLDNGQEGLNACTEEEPNTFQKWGA